MYGFKLSIVEAIAEKTQLNYQQQIEIIKDNREQAKLN